MKVSLLMLPARHTIKPGTPEHGTPSEHRNTPETMETPRNSGALRLSNGGITKHRNNANEEINRRTSTIAAKM